MIEWIWMGYWIDISYTYITSIICQSNIDLKNPHG